MDAARDGAEARRRAGQAGCASAQHATRHQEAPHDTIIAIFFADYSLLRHAHYGTVLYTSLFPENGEGRSEKRKSGNTARKTTKKVETSESLTFRRNTRPGPDEEYHKAQYARDSGHTRIHTITPNRIQTQTRHTNRTETRHSHSRTHTRGRGVLYIPACLAAPA